MSDWWNQQPGDSGGWYATEMPEDAPAGGAPGKDPYGMDAQQQQQAYGAPYDQSYTFGQQPNYYEQPGQSYGDHSSNAYGVGNSSSSAAAANSYGGGMFMPQMNAPPVYEDVTFGKDGGPNAFEGEPPLLEELGINFDHIKQKTFGVLNPFQAPEPAAIQDSDLAGPLVFCLLFGAALLLHGKIQFGYVYGIGLLGCLAMYALLNLMSRDGISITTSVSVVGYCLLPMALLSILAAVLSLKGTVGYALAAAAVLWCSLSASKLFVTALDMDHQQLLVAYPCCLFYGVFALMAIF